MSLAFLPVRISDADFIGEGRGTWFPAPPFRVLVKNFVDAQQTSWRTMCARRCPHGNSNHPKTPKM